MSFYCPYDTLPSCAFANNTNRNSSRRTTSSPRVDPTNYFPQEILSTIFASACKAQIFHHGGQWQRQCYPLRLGHVSRSWRKAAWGTSELWKTIVLPLGRATSLIGTDNLLNEWIERANGHPLDIWMQLPWRSAAHDSSKALCGILVALRKCCERWRTVDLRLTPAFFEIFETEELDPFAGPFSSGLWLPQLETLCFQSHGLEGFVTSLGLDFRNAPKLRELYIGKTKGNNGSVLPAGFQVPHCQIRRLVCYECPQLQLGAVLDFFSALEELEYKKDAKLIPEPDHVIIHEQLKTISVTLADEGDGDIFSSFLILPSLKSIRINSTFNVRYTTKLMDFLRNVQVPLTHLHLESTAFDERDLIITLGLVPSLTHLVIRVAKYLDNIYADNTALSQIFFQQFDPDHGGFFLPCLEEFEYQGGLTVSSIGFLEPFILRTQIRRSSTVCDYEFAKLRRIKIKANQHSGFRKVCIAECSDPKYTSEVLTMMNSGKLVLTNEIGRQWY